MKINTYSIRDLENLTGIKAHTLRMWEQRYGIVKPKRTETNIRFYDAEDLKMMLNVALLNNHGVKISKIAKMSEEELCRKVNETLAKTSDYQAQMAALTVAMIDLNEEQFEKIMATSILQFGFEKTMVQIIFPFLMRIGVLWMTNTINPAQEHFITNLIRQKLIVAIDGQYRTSLPNAQKFILYLPSGELHELSLLFAYYVIKSRGHKVIYLGQNLPLRDLQETQAIHQAQFIMTVITSSPSSDEVEDYISELQTRFPQTRLLLTGFQVVGHDLRDRHNVTVLHKVQDLIEFLEYKLPEEIKESRR